MEGDEEEVVHTALVRSAALIMDGSTLMPAFWVMLAKL